ncbi:MAG: WG repeat-containing protein [Defluviitaleaceae bacterium]|nr:WG repeat-containing protein [Defluviitaleaceae bacterium]
MKKRAFLFFILFLLSACGRRGGGDSSSLFPQNPVLPADFMEQATDLPEPIQLPERTPVPPKTEPAPIPTPAPPVPMPEGEPSLSYYFIVPAIYAEASPFSDGIARVRTDGDEQIFIDTSGNFIHVLPDEVDADEYIFIMPFSEGYARVLYLPDGTRDEMRWGIIDIDGNEIIEPKYDFVGEVSDGVVPVAMRTQNLALEYKLLDIHGNEIVPFGVYRDIQSFSGALARVRGMNRPHGNRHGFINTLGEIVIPLIYNYAHGFSEGLAAVSTGTMGMFGVTREIEFEGVTHIFTTEASFGSEWGFIDGTGNVVVPLIYNEVRNFSDGMAAAAREADTGGGQTQVLWGFVNTAGKEVVPPIYHWVSDFVDGYAIVNAGALVTRGKDEQVGNIIWLGEEMVIGGTYMIIDRWGRELLTLDYDAVGMFSEGILAVNFGRRYRREAGEWGRLQDGLWGYIRFYPTGN